MDQQQIQDLFSRQFGRAPEIIVRAPGRVNLLGEHTDYNQGYVLPMAIARSVWMAAAAGEGAAIRLCSAQREGEVTASLETLRPTKTWADYMLGVVHELQATGRKLSGFDACLWSDIPEGAGLSSSAAIEVAAVTALDTLFGLALSEQDRIQLAHRAENNFVHVHCGIMDQFISVAAKANHALFLDCHSLDAQHIPLQLQKHTVLIIDSRRPRTLASSKYNERRQECETAVELLRSRLPHIASLRDISVDELEKYHDLLPAAIYRRAKHVASENERVLSAVRALRNNDLSAFGSLMIESHVSLKHDYDVSCIELDFLVDAMMQHDAALGARLTGAGFGGCTVNLVESAACDDLCAVIAEKYERKFGLQPQFYRSHASAGAAVVKE